MYNIGHQENTSRNAKGVCEGSNHREQRNPAADPKLLPGWQEAKVPIPKRVET
jgi:hypothetical protein